MAQEQKKQKVTHGRIKKYILYGLFIYIKHTQIHPYTLLQKADETQQHKKKYFHTLSTLDSTLYTT